MRKMSDLLLPVWAVLACLCVGCSSRHESEAVRENSSINYTAADTTAAVPAQEASGRQFIRTADLKFRVQDVTRTTHTIEDLAGKYGGFITSNHLSSSVVSSHTVQIAPDSLLKTSEYRVENNLSLRVPNQNLDSLLRELGRQVLFLDYRIVNADEVSLQLLENKLRTDRAADAEKRYEGAINSRGRKLEETLKGENSRLALQQETDGRTIRNLALADQVRYSTVKLGIYQPITGVQEKIQTPVNPPDWQPGLAAKLAAAWLGGWKMMEVLLVVTIRLWSLLVLGWVLWLGYRRFGVRLMNNPERPGS